MQQRQSLVGSWRGWIDGVLRKKFTRLVPQSVGIVLIVFRHFSDFTKLLREVSHHFRADGSHETTVRRFGVVYLGVWSRLVSELRG